MTSEEKIIRALLPVTATHRIDRIALGTSIGSATIAVRLVLSSRSITILAMPLIWPHTLGAEARVGAEASHFPAHCRELR